MALPKLNIDQVNIMLMLVSCGIAFAIPFELVLISYAFLGPAHYLTEISWLHDRDYFTGVKWIWAPLTLMVVAMLSLTLFTKDNLTGTYLILCTAFALSGALALAKSFRTRVAAFAAFLTGFAVLRAVPGFELGWAILLPTVIHIYIFTGLFILMGAMKNKSRWGYASLAVFFACGLSYIFIVPSTTIISTDFVDKNLGFFDGVVDYMAEVASFGGLVNGHSVLAFLSFAYTYHYLNWFSKTEIIKWHLIPRRRLYLIAALYALSVSIVLYDFMTGLIALTFLSVAHVFLEFPLNVISIKTVGTSLIPRRAYVRS